MNRDEMYVDCERCGETVEIPAVVTDGTILVCDTCGAHYTVTDKPTGVRVSGAWYPQSWYPPGRKGVRQ